MANEKQCKKYGKIYVGLPNDDANVIFNEEDD